jgi:protein-tyrosine-phosphatase
MKAAEFWDLVIKSPRVWLIFICLGNICRSPFAEMKFEQLLQESKVKNKTKFIISSGGFIDQKIAIHPLTKRALLEEGIAEERVNRFHARTMRKHKEDMEQANVLIAMNISTRDVQIPGKHQAKSITLSEIALNGQEIDIPDPALIEDYNEYRKTMIQITDYLQRIITKMEELGI